MLADAHAGPRAKGHPGAARHGRGLRHEALGHEAQRVGEVARITLQHPGRDAQHPAFFNVAAAQAEVLGGAAQHQRPHRRVEAHGFFERGGEPWQARHVFGFGLAALQHAVHFILGTLGQARVLSHQAAPPQQGAGGGFVPGLESDHTLVKHLHGAQRLAGLLVAQRQQHGQKVLASVVRRGLAALVDVAAHQLAHHLQRLIFGTLARQR